ncbi:Nucleotide-binding protein 35 [Giardia muris]|uniref:Nucleotide-binding protein 35 n=1 Tax=Giardia muris TaxID=5742 RepID=A0A4Z1SWZ6_GIAMU|nr:Nucleotide-binding protein 35 [Giardia muris]|eukprot:TNJ30246.1 Nucleotide-binding protein 35 [Giardia muris]
MSTEEHKEVSEQRSVHAPTSRSCAPSSCSTCPSKKSCTGRGASNENYEKLANRIKGLGHIILVLSGKGGVGKSTVATQLAYFFADALRKRVGLLDIDICGPSAPTMTCTRDEEVLNDEKGWQPVSPMSNLQILSIGYMLQTHDAPVIFRGSKKHSMIVQFSTEACWNFEGHPANDNYLIVDTPPGTSDEHISVIDLYKGAIRYMEDNKFEVIPTLEAVVVATSQEVALADVRKEINFCRSSGLTIKGVIENMSGFVCPHCNSETLLFQATTGGVLNMCKGMELEYLGRIPMDPQLMAAGDRGEPWAAVCDTDSSIGFEAFTEICMRLIYK